MSIDTETFPAANPAAAVDPTQQMSDGLFHELLGSEPEPAFDTEQELASGWGRKWGAADEVSKLRLVMVRAPSRGMAAIAEAGEAAWREDMQAYVDPNLRWYWTGHELPDLELLDEQFQGFVRALEGEGVEVVIAPEMDPSFTKAVFTRDSSVTIPGGAIVCRMGPRMRRGEEQAVTRTLANAGMPILGTITGTGLVEGGSFVKVARDRAFFGTSVRCNVEGYRQLRYLLAGQGIELERVQMPGFQIHLDLCCLMLDDDLALINPRIAPFDFQTRLHELGVETVAVAPNEDWGCNALVVDRRRVIFPSHLPATAELLNSRHGVEVIPVAYREMNKNGGGLHCSSTELQRDW